MAAPAPRSWVTPVLAIVAACAAPRPADPPRVELLPAREQEPPPRPAAPTLGGGLLPCRDDAAGGAACGGPAAQAPAPRAVDPTIWRVPLGSDDPARGAAAAWVTLVVFSDFQCPFCRRAATTVNRVLARDPEGLRLVWKDLPLPMHEHAVAAAELARVARDLQGDPGFFRAHDALFAAQDELGPEAFRRIASELDLPWSRVDRAMRESTHGLVIQASVLVSDLLGVDATPTLFVNGRKLVGAPDEARLVALIDEERARARRVAGTEHPPPGLHERLVADGKQLRPTRDTPAP